MEMKLLRNTSPRKQSGMSYLKKLYKAKFYLVFAIVLVLSTVYMMCCVIKFDMGYGMKHPQFFPSISHIENFIDIQQNAEQWKYYTRFFWVDMIWAFSLLVSLHGLITKWTKSSKNTHVPYVANWYFISFAGLAYGFDFVENSLYLGFGIEGGCSNAIPYIRTSKIFLYATVFLYTLLKTTKRYGL